MHNRDQTFCEDCVIHPTTLDSVLHLALVAQSEGRSKPFPPIALSRLQSLWVNAALITMPSEPGVTASVETVSTGFRDVEWNIAAVDTAWQSPMLVAKGLRGTASQGLDYAVREDKTYDKLCSTLHWQPELGFMSDQQCQRHFNESIVRPQFSSLTDITVAEDLALQYVLTNVDHAVSVQGKSSAHMSRYIDWMKSTAARWKSSHSSTVNTVDLSTPAACDPVQRAIACVGSKLRQILDRRIDALQLLYEDGLAEGFYRNGRSVALYKTMSEYIKVLAHVNPDMQFLEVGAGTGSATSEILHALNSPQPRYDCYTFTDVSAKFLEDARQRFHKHIDRMQFGILDVGQSPESQGFEMHTYDIIVAVCVLHATPNLSETLKNLRSLLKDDGKLILYELCNPSKLTVGFVFGLLPGWWLGTEDFRPHGPLVDESRWQSLLEKAGFQTDVLKFQDQKDPDHWAGTIFTATAASRQESRTGRLIDPSVVLVWSKNSVLQATVASGLERQLTEQYHRKSVTISLEDALDQDWQQKAVVFLEALDSDVLHDLHDRKFRAVQKMLVHSSYALWVTRGAGLLPNTPKADFIRGLARTICFEGDGDFVVTLALENDTPEATAIGHVCSVLDNLLKNPGRTHDTEYVEHRGLLHVGRIMADPDLNALVRSSKVGNDILPSILDSTSRQDWLLSIKTPGLLETLHFVENPNPPGPLEEDEVEIQVKAAGLNFRDIMVALGQIPGDHLGLEVAGIVNLCGARSGFQIGDKVVALPSGAFATYVRCKAYAVHQMPHDISFENAAAYPLAACTAYYALVTLARLRPGESVLVHSGAGGVGQSALQLARHIGATVFTTVGSDEKKRLLMEQYGLPSEKIWSSRDTSFAAEISRATNSKGVDVVINSLSGELLQASWRCVAPFGRFIETGKRDINDNGVLPMDGFANNVSFACADLAAVGFRRQ